MEAVFIVYGKFFATMMTIVAIGVIIIGFTRRHFTVGVIANSIATIIWLVFLFYYRPILVEFAAIKGADFTSRLYGQMYAWLVGLGVNTLLFFYYSWLYRRRTG